MHLLKTALKVLLTGTISGIILALLAYWSLGLLGNWAWVFNYSVVFVYFILLAFISNTQKLKLACIYAGMVFLALGVYEAWLVNQFQKQFPQAQVTMEGDCAAGEYYFFEPYLGFGPKSDGHFSCRKFDGDGSAIYDVHYTIENGLRKVPGSYPDAENVALFFGCSFTFGEGLHDHEPLAGSFSMQTEKQARFLNYGFHGYGPHHMLRNIETRVPGDVGRFDGRGVAVYQFLPDHLLRAAGLTEWDRSGPRYRIENGEAVWAGNFGFQLSGMPEINNILRLGMLSMARSRVFSGLFINRPYRSEDIDRVIAIVAKSAELLSELNVEFHLVVWDVAEHRAFFHSDDDFNYLIDEVRALGIPVYLVSELLAEHDHTELYLHETKDRHPNAQTNAFLARELMELINFN